MLDSNEIPLSYYNMQGSKFVLMFQVNMLTVPPSEGLK
jgi:hypothetical protein